ncbi:hypothetical protein ACFUTX_00385 [Microbacterium sp. NPDC057407]|uniref:hypothetical protein n=1 Tax=Microbacterium sp. NPDC057407 TaxID=3346120 RepID=UPI00366B7118
MDFPALAGAVSAVLFAVANLPMLVKALHTRDVHSYSRSALALTMVGNVLYTPYVLTLPPGPIWAMHGFYILSTGVILVLSMAPSRRGRDGATMSHASERRG